MEGAAVNLGTLRRWSLCLVALPLLAASPDVQHRVVLETDTVRVALLSLEPAADTGQHGHAHPHVAAALSDGDLIDVTPDGSERPRTMKEGDLAFVPAGVTHALRNRGASTFRAVTIDLLRPQTGERNRCASLLPGQPTDCPKPTEKPKGAVLVLQMETDQTRVSLLTLAPGKEFKFEGAATPPPIVVALAGADARAILELHLPGSVGGRGEKPLREGDAASGLENTPLTIRNAGSAPARFVVLEFR